MSPTSYRAAPPRGDVVTLPRGALVRQPPALLSVRPRRRAALYRKAEAEAAAALGIGSAARAPRRIRGRPAGRAHAAIAQVLRQWRQEAGLVGHGRLRRPEITVRRAGRDLVRLRRRRLYL